MLRHESGVSHDLALVGGPVALFLPDSALKSGFDETHTPPPPQTGPQFLNQLSLDVSLGDPAKPFPALAISHMDQETSAAHGRRKMRTWAAGAGGVTHGC